MNVDSSRACQSAGCTAKGFHLRTASSVGWILAPVPAGTRTILKFGRGREFIHSVIFFQRWPCAVVSLHHYFELGCLYCGPFGMPQHWRRVRKRSLKILKSHESSCNMVGTSNEAAALRHWLDNDSPETDGVDLEVQHIFQRKDYGTAQFKAETSTTPKEPATNQKVWILIAIRSNFQTWREIAQSFICKNSLPTVAHLNYKEETNSHCSMIGTQVIERRLRHRVLCGRARVSFPKTQREFSFFEEIMSPLASGESSIATRCQWDRIHLV